MYILSQRPLFPGAFDEGESEVIGTFKSMYDVVIIAAKYLGEGRGEVRVSSELPPASALLRAGDLPDLDAETIRAALSRELI